MEASPATKPHTIAADRARGQRPDPLGHTAVLVLAAGALLISLLLEVRGGESVSVPGVSAVLPELCYYKRMFGSNCPGCGLTRAFIALAHGNLAAAWHYNPASLLVFVAVVFQIPYQSTQLWRVYQGKPALRWKWLHWMALVVVLALPAQWLVRLLSG